MVVRDTCNRVLFAKKIPIRPFHIYIAQSLLIVIKFRCAFAGNKKDGAVIKLAVFIIFYLVFQPVQEFLRVGGEGHRFGHLLTI